MAIKLSPNRKQILYQCFVAFGQGTMGFRIPRRTCQELEDFLMSRVVDPGRAKELIKNWDHEEYAPQVLERLRALGHTSAHFAAADGSTKIRPEHLRMAIPKVVAESRSTYCGIGPYNPP